MVLRNVSTSADEYLPMLSPDNELLFFTRKSKYQAKGGSARTDVEQLMEARRRNVQEDFDKGRALPEPFNLGADNYGGVTISVNNKEVFVTVCGPPTRAQELPQLRHLPHPLRHAHGFRHRPAGSGNGPVWTTSANINSRRTGKASPP